MTWGFWCTLAACQVCPRIDECAGRNAGTRRARGQYILGTAVDNVFASAFAEMIARRRFSPRTMYRSPRASVTLGLRRGEPLGATLGTTCQKAASAQFDASQADEGASSIPAPLKHTVLGPRAFTASDPTVSAVL